MLLRRNPEVEAAPLKDELLVFDGKGNKFFVMNVTAAFLWKRLETPAEERDLVEGLCAAFTGVTQEQARSDVGDTVREMLTLGLLVNSDTIGK